MYYVVFLHLCGTSGGQLNLNGLNMMQGFFRSYYRAVGAGPAGAAVAGPILKMAPGATHGKWASRKLCNTLLGYIKSRRLSNSCYFTPRMH